MPETAAYQFDMNVASADSDNKDDADLYIDGQLILHLSLLPKGSSFGLQKWPGTFQVTDNFQGGLHTCQWVFHGTLTTLLFDSFTFTPIQTYEAVYKIASAGSPATVHGPDDSNPDGVLQFAANGQSITVPLYVPYAGNYDLGLRTSTAFSTAKIQISINNKTYNATAPHNSHGLFQQWYLGDTPNSPLTPTGATRIALTPGVWLVTIKDVQSAPTVSLLLDTLYLSPISGVASIG